MNTGDGLTRRLLCALLCCYGPLLTAVHAQTWVEDSFEDFADGSLDASGQNLYVSRDGKVRTIHRFDLNDDGHIDLLFNSTHDEYNFIPATLLTVGPGQEIRQQLVAVEGSLRIAVGDLNRDGWPDLAFCPNPSGIQNPRRFVTLVWGGPDGWPAHRSNGVLPVRDAKTIAIADLNHDDWPDILVLNGEAWMRGQPDGKIIRVFWGGKNGFLLTRYSDWGVPGALDMASGDFDSDGAVDLAVLRFDKKIQLFWAKPGEGASARPCESQVALSDDGAQCLTAADVDGDSRCDLVIGTEKKVLYLLTNRGGRAWSEPASIPAFDASRVTIGDLDGDKQSDLVLTQFAVAKAAGGEIVGAKKDLSDVIHVLWGDKHGFSASRSLQLPVAYASGTAIGDLNGDGLPDLAVAVYQGSQTFAAESLVFFGRGQRRLERGRYCARTEGAADVVIVPPYKGLPARTVICNSRGGALSEKVPLLLYWGGPDGFDAKRRMEIPFASGYEGSAADLNADGFTDLVAMNSGHLGLEGAKGATGLGANIFWGGKTGIDPSGHRTVLRHYAVWCSNVADLNRDGYLDIVLGTFASASPNEPEPMILYYGTPDGFDEQHRQILPCQGESCGCVIADFNKDAWLDVAATSYGQHRIRIFWGSSKGFSAERQGRIDVPSPIDLETADLNADGWLDLIAGSYQDPVSNHHDAGTSIFWGSPHGFRQWNAQWLPGLASVGPTVADFDGDGFLDLFCPHYHADLTRESMPCYLYWGSQDGFGTRRRTVLICDSADDALAADFDRDGRLDLAVANHTVDGDHRTFSKVFYNDGNRFANPRIVKLPTFGCHWIWLQDMGHIYNRQWCQQYESSVFRWDGSVSKGQVDIKADVPAGTGLTFSVRAASTASELGRQPWRDVQVGRVALKPADRCLQYRAVFRSDNGDRYAVLDKVTITLISE